MFFLNLNVTSRNCFLWAFWTNLILQVCMWSCEIWAILSNDSSGKIEFESDSTSVVKLSEREEIQERACSLHTTDYNSIMPDLVPTSIMHGGRFGFYFFAKRDTPINSDTLDCEKLVKWCKFFVLAAGDFVTGEKIIGIIKNWW